MVECEWIWKWGRKWGLERGKGGGSEKMKSELFILTLYYLVKCSKPIAFKFRKIVKKLLL